MHLIVRDFPDGLVEVLKRKSGQAAASKAVVDACFASVSQAEQLESQRIKIRDLEHQLQVAHQVIGRARDAAAQLLDHVAQKDLFDV